MPKLQSLPFPELKKQDIAFSKNTHYWFLNESRYNWKRFITLLAVRVTGYFNFLTKADCIISLVLDHSVIPRERSKKVELLSRVYDHVIHKTVKGFNMLALGWTDGYSSSTAIVFTRYIILEWLCRKNHAQKTICELFYVCCDDIQGIELCTDLK